ncbi:polyprenyl synthetase family protein [Desulfonatronovibrio magnus]|uniref:polyprenyl synthetase family protein n=1 Tax=Desulfonatronovibrio magnus TaxID=698827 RepID=UPI000A460C50|nr:farnesyl diphosphate synthase [Desulfonatronovibrio magnus]
MNSKPDDFKIYLKSAADAVNSHLSTCLALPGIPDELKDSMNYSLLAGGKRIRPILCMTWARMLGVNQEEILNFACAIELIHTYSLIHDDLPCMDNDDLRRGKPTNHKLFGEAMAVLAGDGLLTHAFNMMARTDLPADNVLKALCEMSDAAGPCSMVGGQVVDIMSTGSQEIKLQDLQKMHAMKTGALIRSSCVCGAVLALSRQAEKQDLDNASEYGKSIGLAFQIVDDILDITGDEAALGKPVGSDEASDKATYPRFLGIDESRKLAKSCIDDARAALESYAGAEKIFLSNLAGYILDRAS